MKKKLIILIIRDHKSVSTEWTSSVELDILQFEEPSLNCDWIISKDLDGFKKSKWASFERDCRLDNLFCKSIGSSSGPQDTQQKST